jgi:hypothetical protein
MISRALEGKKHSMKVMRDDSTWKTVVELSLVFKDLHQPVIMEVKEKLIKK